MNSLERIKSILNTKSLDTSVTGVPTFSLSALNHLAYPTFNLPTDLRLGHMVEKVVAELLKSSTNYNVLYENVQIINEKKTIGEIDFIIEEGATKKAIHLELAYKFYLLDFNNSSDALGQWIGPNRNDSLVKKLEKLKQKQFPLLYNESAITALSSLNTAHVSQELCLLVSLFVPYNSKHNLDDAYKKAVVGYYINYNAFLAQNHKGKTYIVVPKKYWGLNPKLGETWQEFTAIKQIVETSILERQSVLCWQKQNNNYTAFFITFW